MFRVIYLQILEVYFASVHVISWNTFSNITHNGVIWCLNLWAPVCNLRNTTRRQSFNGFVWYITGRFSALRWLIAGLNNLKMHLLWKQCRKRFYFFSVSHVYGRFLCWIYKWKFHFQNGSSGKLDWFFWWVCWLVGWGFFWLFGVFFCFFNYSTSLPNWISGTPHPATSLPLTAIPVIVNVPYIASLRCS